MKRLKFYYLLIKCDVIYFIFQLGWGVIMIMSVVFGNHKPCPFLGQLLVITIHITLQPWWLVNYVTSLYCISMQAFSIWYLLVLSTSVLFVTVPSVLKGNNFYVSTLCTLFICESCCFYALSLCIYNVLVLYNHS